MVSTAPSSTTFQAPSTDLTRVMTILEHAVQDARRRGYRIGGGRFTLRVVDGRYAGSRVAPICPIAAVLLGTETLVRKPTLQGYFDDASVALKVSKAWIDEFLSGFDDSEDPCGLCDEAWYCGAQFRRRFLEDGDYITN